MVKFGLVASLVVRLALLNCFLGRYVAEGDTVAPPPHTNLSPFLRVLVASAAAALSFCFNSSSVSYSFPLFVGLSRGSSLPKKAIVSFVHCHWRYYVDGGCRGKSRLASIVD